MVKTRALKWLGASASLSLTINCPLMMRTTTSLHPLAMITHHLPIEITPLLIPCHHPREDRGLLLFLLVRLHLHQPREKRLLLLHLHQRRENRILVVILLLHLSPKQDQGHPRSRRKGPWIRSLMLPKWTNRKEKGRSVAALPP